MDGNIQEMNEEKEWNTEANIILNSKKDQNVVCRSKYTGEKWNRSKKEINEVVSNTKTATTKEESE